MPATRRLVLALPLLVTVLLATPRPANAIINGDLDGNGHPYVGTVGGCTGTAISPTVVVTAAHCVDEGQPYRVSFKPAPDGSAAGVYEGTGHVVTDFCASCGPGIPDFASPDVSVVVLDAPVSLPRYASLPDAGGVDALRVKQGVTLVGYGTTTILRGGGLPGFTFDVVRRTAPAELLATSQSFADSYLRMTAKQHVAGCFGDSGGPVLLGDTLLAVQSFGINPYCSSPDYASRVDLPYLLAAIRAFA